ncbi:unnamed protein product [Euphydryas editha]|uniref:RNA-directed DNA polymerase n=1 Tax=Euphydryas editha TaxID=104508 RepID=A0AAU9TGM7_EUPED|nr:unnamed protein product [Euphydryas editha]
MADSDDEGYPPRSEVGSHALPTEEKQPPDENSALKMLSNMEILLTRMLATTQPPVATASAQSSAVKLVEFNPDDADADIEGWCKITELIVLTKHLEGVDLLVALTSALKGRAASCLTKLNLNELTWETVKQSLMARFYKPKLIQDYFDEILRFQVGTKETAAEAGLRLWNMIETIPETRMPEEVITGFVISILCQKDGLMRRELSAYTVTTKPQLFRILRGISLKRRSEVTEIQEPDFKRPRIPGKCHFCGIPGHRQVDCRKRLREDSSGMTKQQDPSTATRAPEKTSTVTCYICGQAGHIATNCKEKGKGGGATARGEVNVCEQRLSRGTLRTSSGESVSFLFDSGSSCSLIKQSYSSKFPGTVRNDLVYLTGIGGDEIKSTTQISSEVNLGNFIKLLTFHVVPNSCLTDPVIIGRDILENGVSVEINNDNLIFHFKEQVNVCESTATQPDFTRIDTDLTADDRDALIRLLNKYASSFVDGVPRRRVNTGELEIDLVDPHKTVQRRPYRLAPTEKQIVREKVQELLDAGVIRESSSPFASPILLVKKKDNTERMCVDYRELNSNTRPEHYPLPRIEEQIDQLSGAHYFSSLDMASGFHQIPIHHDSVEKTAFVTPEGQYEYLAMPFGLRNAPSVYQRCITKAVHQLKDKPLIYMDDVLCYSGDISEGLKRLDEVLSALCAAGFSLNLKKCQFMKKKIDFLGYSIQCGQVGPNSRKIQALIDSPQPKTATQVRQFLGLASYFRKFIPGFTNIVGPLYPLTKLRGPIKWEEKHESIRHTIIQILTSEPVLMIFDPDLPVELHCDASSEGYGAILIQKKKDLPHVVEYFSRRTSEAESRYHSYELETLAVVRAVEHFRHYLYGRRFKVFTDCNSLKVSKSKTDLTPRVHRWWAFLQAYDFDIIYREGRSMEHADYLSRNPLPDPNHLVSESQVSSKPTIQTVNFVELHQGWLSVEQKRDAEVQDLINKHNNNDFPETIGQTYDVRDGILYRKVVRNKIISWLPVVPRSLIWTLINHVHNELQHLGSDKTLDKLYEQYWFPQMSKCVRKFIDSCIVCKASKGPSGAQPVQLHSIPKAPVPWHTIHIDFTGKLSGKSDRKEYCSVIIDAFTKYVLLEHTSSLDAASAVRAVKNAVCLFGAPKRIIADQGRCYISQDFKNFCSEHNIKLHFIATGSSRANGQVERVMRTLKSLLTIIENDPNKAWRDELGNVQLALNSTRSTVTKFTPTELMFGIRSQSLGMSRIRCLSPDSEQEQRVDVESARQDASLNIQRAAASDTLRFNQGRATIKPFSKGDFVFIKSCERNQTKLDRKFRGPYVIIAVLDNDRYELKSITGSHRTFKYAHENLRPVPRGHDGLVEISTSLMNEEEAMTAPEDVELDNSHLDRPNSCDTLTAGSDTLSAGSDTLTAESDTLSNISDREIIEHEVQIHAEQDSP